MVQLSQLLKQGLLAVRLQLPDTKIFKIAVKAGVAALLADLGAQLLGLRSPLWAAISAVIVMQANLGSSFSASWQRLVGTAVGVLVGIVLVSLGGHNILLLGAGTALTVLVCAALGVYESFRIATVTFVLVALLSGTEPWSFGLHRFLDVAFGLLVALAVTVGLWPPRARRDLRYTLAALLEADARLYQPLLESYLSSSDASAAVLEARDVIKELLATARTLIGDIGREPPGAEDPALTSLLVVVERLQEDLFTLDRGIAGGGNGGLQNHLSAEFENLAKSTVATFATLAAALREPQSVDYPSQLSQAVQALDERFGELRRARVPSQYSAEELLRFTSFLFRVQQVAVELENLAAEITGLVSATTRTGSLVRLLRPQLSWRSGKIAR